ncbi:MAG TPA: flavin reductase family protein [Sulfolobales archaeon]|nr:flavin reductase family protein [Sulfolobales archaeon]
MELADIFRDVMRRYPTGVTVVTSYLDGTPSGLTVNSFTSISIKPPTIGVFITTGSTGYRAIRSTRSYAVNILKHDQDWIAKRFSLDPPGKRFIDLHWFRSRVLGLPVISNSLAYIEARVVSEIDIADHTLFVGEVVSAEILNDAEPLVYHMRTYKKV